MLNDRNLSQCASAEELVAVLHDYAAGSRAVSHPLLDAISRGAFRNLTGAIIRFMQQYYFYSHRFTQYLAAVMSKLDNPVHRAMLVPNAMEEGGYVSEEQGAELRAAGIEPGDVASPHTELFRRFLTAIGLSYADILSQTPYVATTAWITTFDAACRLGSQEQAIGAIGLGTEAIVRNIYTKLLAGIKLAWPDMSMRDRAFFELHALVDDDHAEVMRGITIDLCQTEAGRRQVAVGVVQAINARTSFFDSMHGILRTMDRSQERAA